jgi:predicted DNA-binding mobile mystery protein A
MSKRYKQIAREQGSSLINQVAALQRHQAPKTGWIKTVRSALAMSGAALSKRLGGHRSTAAYLERSELDGSVTLKKMQQVAEVVNCRFVYAIVPPHGKTIESLLNERAEVVARRIVEQTSVQMMLEAQQLSTSAREKEVQRLQEELLRQLPRDFWDDEIVNGK